MRLATGFLLAWCAVAAVGVGFGGHIYRWEVFTYLAVIAFLAVANCYSWRQYLGAKKRIADDWKERIELEKKLRRVQPWS